MVRISGTSRPIVCRPSLDRMLDSGTYTDAVAAGTGIGRLCGELHGTEQAVQTPVILIFQPGCARVFVAGDGEHVVAINSRFFRSLRAQKTDQSFALLELLKEKDAPDTDYMELLATYNARDFEKLVELADKFPKENRNYQPVMVLRTEAQARLGNIQGFIDSFKAVDDEVVDTVHFLFL